VASTGIEPVSGASEALILSIVLRGRESSGFQSMIFSCLGKNKNQKLNKSGSIGRKDFHGNGQQNYINLRDFNTANITTRLARMAMSMVGES
jgi:hypothetical protein